MACILRWLPISPFFYFVSIQALSAPLPGQQTFHPHIVQLMNVTELHSSHIPQPSTHNPQAEVQKVQVAWTAKVPKRRKIGIKQNIERRLNDTH